uniref:Uncharacterized protein n=1 Tax=Pyricularia oryzae (strain P131) TaxID=1143193 RepID=L7JFF8_PYRO1
MAHFAYLESPQARPVLYEVDCYFRCRYLRTAWIMSISSKLAPSIRPTWPMGRSLVISGLTYLMKSKLNVLLQRWYKEKKCMLKRGDAGERGGPRQDSGIDILDSENSKPIRTTLEPPNKNSAMHAAPPNPRSENAGRSMLPICVH